MKIDLTKVKTKDIDGKPIKYDEDSMPLHKHIANILYRKARNLDLVDIAMQINQGQAVEMSKADIAEMRSLINEQNGVFSFARKAVFEYLDKIEEAEKKKKKK